MPLPLFSILSKLSIKLSTTKIIMGSSNLAEIGARLIDGQLKSKKALAGGCLAECLQITLTDGRQAVVKNGPAPPVEADMLRAIIASGAPAPAVLAVNDKALVIQLLRADGGLGSSKSWTSLGKAMAKLHSATGEGRYGWPENFAFPPLEISNQWTDDWPQFWAERRLLPHVDHVPNEIGNRLQKLCEQLPSRLPAKPRPALLHGDIWGGNVLVDGEGQVSGLIDPACYYGHNEVDFAMLTLFGRPTREFYDAYGLMEEGWEGRRPIYQLWTALVHLRLFGGGYRSMVDGLLAKAGV